MNAIKRIAINTGGGDAPGLNAVIQAAVYAARNLGWEIFGIRDGLDGLLDPDSYPDGGLIKLTRPVVRNIVHLGGTMLGTSNRGNPFKTHGIRRSPATFQRTSTRRAHFRRRRWHTGHRPRVE